jgi:hypothetical protein
MRTLNPNINRAAALSARIAAFGLFAIRTRLITAFRAGRGVDSTLYKRGAGLRLNLRHSPYNGILRQGTGQYRDLGRRNLHGNLRKARATYRLLQQYVKGTVNQKILNDLVVNLIRKHVLLHAVKGGHEAWPI